MKIQYPDGSKYEGEVQNEQKNGIGIFFDGVSVYDGCFQNDRFVNGQIITKRNQLTQIFSGSADYSHGQIESFEDEVNFEGVQFIPDSLLSIKLIQESQVTHKGTVEIYDGQDLILQYKGTLQNWKYQSGTLQSSNQQFEGEFTGNGKYLRGKLKTEQIFYNGSFMNNKFQGYGELVNKIEKYQFIGEFNNGMFQQGSFDNQYVSIKGEYTEGIVNKCTVIFKQELETQIPIIQLQFRGQELFESLKILNLFQKCEIVDNENIMSWPWNADGISQLTPDLFTQIKQCHIVHNIENNYTVQIEFFNFITFDGELNQQLYLNPQQVFTNFSLQNATGQLKLPDDQGEFEIKFVNSEIKYLKGYFKDSNSELKIEFNGQKYFIECGDYSYSGLSNFGTLVNNQYNIKYIGQFKQFLRHGKGRILFQNGTEIVGQFKDDILDFEQIIEIKGTQQGDLQSFITNEKGQLKIQSLVGNSFKMMLSSMDEVKEFQTQINSKFQQFNQEVQITIRDNTILNQILNDLAQMISNENNTNQIVSHNIVQIGSFNDFQLNGFGFQKANQKYQVGQFVMNKLCLGLEVSDEQIKIGQFDDFEKLNKKSMIINDEQIQYGTFLNDLLAFGTSVYLNSNSRFIGEFVDGFPNGQGKYTNGQTVVNGIFVTKEKSNSIEIQFEDAQDLRTNLDNSLALTNSISQQEYLQDIQIIGQQTSQLMQNQLFSNIFVINDQVVQPVGEFTIQTDICYFKGEIYNQQVINKFKFVYNSVSIEGIYINPHQFNGIVNTPFTQAEGEFINYQLQTGQFSSDLIIQKGLFTDFKLNCDNAFIKTADYEFKGKVISGSKINGTYKTETEEFEGEFENDEYKNGHLKRENVKYDGEFYLGLKQGSGKLTITENNGVEIVYEGTFQNDQFEGFGELKIINKDDVQIFTGQFADNQLNDENATYTHGEKKFVGHIIGLDLQKGQMTTPSQQFVGEFKNMNYYQGELKEKDMIYNGQFENNQIINGEIGLNVTLNIFGMEMVLFKIVVENGTKSLVLLLGEQEVQYSGQFDSDTYKLLKGKFTTKSEGCQTLFF
ncbi:putative_phosphatidylinositol phosphate kinase [Hexamita inflata]|uniref:Phosphatidylinositol phosphate kinase n=1 Tax=Hexamita inflata TaxID=28002 RepID=A0AA86UV39_9EUKA|nr:putative phosphatidylinositol phosphate kinase [Hexamita inflata]